MPYQPIENYGLIGNMRTSALVGMNGSIDWFCYPHFDSPSIFASILDEDKGGKFSIAPTSNNVTNKQYYWPDTNVLVTRFLSPQGVSRILDFMPVGFQAGEGHRNGLIRRVQAIRGTMDFRIECHPAFNYARTAHKTLLTKNSAIFESPELTLRLGGSITFQQVGDGVIAEFTLKEGEEIDFSFQEVHPKRERRDSIFRIPS